MPPHLMQMINACETACDRGCCGLDAFSVEPITLGAYLSRTREDLIPTQAATIREEIQAWKSAFGSASGHQQGYASPATELNWIFSPDAVDEFAERLFHNLTVALDLIAESTRRKFVSDAERGEAQRSEDEAKAWRKDADEDRKAKAFISEIFNRIAERRSKE